MLVNKINALELKIINKASSNDFMGIIKGENFSL